MVFNSKTTLNWITYHETTCSYLTHITSHIFASKHNVDSALFFSISTYFYQSSNDHKIFENEYSTVLIILIKIHSNKILNINLFNMDFPDEKFQSTKHTDTELIIQCKLQMIWNKIMSIIIVYVEIILLQ